MTDTLAHVATNTESTKNPGNAILYEVVQTIMSIDSEPALRVLAINILGRFLQNRENNIRYVALNTLCKVVHADTQAIQRHRNTIVDCLKDADISIRRRALDLIYALVNSSNIKALVRELLNYLVLASADAEFKSDLTEKICIVVERFAPSKRWQLDTLVRVLENAGNFTRSYVASDFVIVVSGDANLQAYAVHKLYQAMRRTLSHKPLLHVGLWCIGEYGDLLCSENGVDAANAGATAEGEDEFATRVKESEVLELIDTIMKLIDLAVETKQYLVAALGKLTGRFGNTDAIQRLLSAYSTSMTVDLQQRSLEYDALAQEVSSSVRQVRLFWSLCVLLLFYQTLLLFWVVDFRRSLLAFPR
jgi:AP-1 complex subunit gamma-1